MLVTGMCFVGCYTGLEDRSYVYRVNVCLLVCQDSYSTSCCSSISFRPRLFVAALRREAVRSEFVVDMKTGLSMIYKHEDHDLEIQLLIVAVVSQRVLQNL